MQETKQEKLGEWKRPEDIVTFRTANQAEMIGKYLPRRVLKTWKEDVTDEDTGEIVSIERNEVLFDAGQKITKDLAAKIMFSIQAGEIEDVEVSEDLVLPAERYIGHYFINYAVGISANSVKRLFVVRAQNIETAIKVAVDFANVYRGANGLITPIKVNPVNCTIIDDDDDCIPEEERIALELEKDYYMVNVRFLEFDNNEQKWEKTDYNYLITADDVGQAKKRVESYCNDVFDEALKRHPENKFVIRKAAPFETDGLVPKEYCLLYKQTPTI